MDNSGKKLVLVSIAIALGILGCSLQAAAGYPAGTVTSLSGTFAALQTGTAAALAATSTAAAVPVPSPTSSETSMPAPATATPRNPTVATLALCWTGPGNAYPVVSSVKVGTAVELIGVGSVPGWFIVKNPIYRDLCWIEAKNLQIDPNFNLSGLKVYNPPPTPGPTETPVPTPT